MPALGVEQIFAGGMCLKAAHCRGCILYDNIISLSYVGKKHNLTVN